MKRKLLLTFLMIVALACVLVITAGATKINKDTTVTIDGGYTDVNGSTVTTINLYDADGDALIWYLNTDGKLVSAKIASLVTVDAEGVISFTDKTIFKDKDTAKSVIAINLRDNVKVSGTDINWDGQIKHFDSTKGVNEDTSFAASGFQFGTYNNTAKFTIQYFYFPITTESTVRRMFQNTPIKVADFEPGTPLKKIGIVSFYNAKNLQTIFIPNDLEVMTSASQAGMFQNCSSLSSVVFEEGSKLWDAGHTTFYGCTSLKELYLPNSVITIGSEFARSSGIETFSFGANFQYVTRRDKNKDPDDSHIWVFYSAPLKTVYMPASFALLSDAYDFDDYVSNDERLDTFDRMFNNAGSFTLIFTGTDKEFDKLKTRFSYTQENQSMMNALKKVYSYEEYLAAGSPSGSCAVYGYNACQAYYGGVHEISNKYVFENFVKESYMAQTCANCDIEQKGEIFAPIVELLGVSAKMDGSAVTIGYSIDKDSAQLYETKTGKVFNYGVVAYIPVQGTSCNPLQVTENGVEAVEKDFTIHAAIEENNYASVDFVIKGFPTTETSLAMCMYVYDGQNIAYLCGTKGANVEQGTSSDLTQEQSAYLITIDMSNGEVTK